MENQDNLPFDTDQLGIFRWWKGVIQPTNAWNQLHNPEKCKRLATSSHDGKKAMPDDWFETWETIQKLGGSK